MKKAWSLALGLVLTVAACSTPRQEVIAVGFLTSLTGKTADFGQGQIRGAELAAAEINQLGGILLNGRYHRLQLIVEDTASLPEMALEKAQKLLYRHRVVALIGPFVSQTAIPVTNLAEKTGVPMICPAASHPQITANKEFIFRLAFTDAHQGRFLARLAHHELGAERAAAFYDKTNSHSREISEVFLSEFSRLGGNTVSEFYLAGSDSWEASLRRIATAKPQILFLPNLGRDAASQANLARQLGLTATFLGSDSWNIRDLAGEPVLDGAYLTGHWHPDLDREESRTFRQTFRAVNGEEPTTGAALAYDALRLIALAIETSNSLAGDALRQSLNEMESFPGAVGPVSFRGSRDPEWPIVLLRFEQGKVSIQPTSLHSRRPKERP